MNLQEMLQEKHKEKIAKLKEVVFDTLGDMIPPEKVGVQVLSGGKLALYIDGNIDLPEKMVADEWEMAREDTEFSDVEFYCKEGR